MAAVDTPPPISPTSSSPSRRKPVPLRGLASIESYGWDENAAKPLPGVPSAESPRLRESPVSPVKVNFMSEAWPQPSNTNIETQRSSRNDLSERALPRTPEAPTPPPHSPLYDQDALRKPVPHIPSIQSASTAFEKPLPIPTIPPHQLRQEGYTSSLSNQEYEFSQPPPSGAFTAEPDAISISEESTRTDLNRHSRESDVTASTQLQASTQSSATTSASSVSGVIEALDGPDKSLDDSPESSILDDATARAEMVPQLQYHHSAFLPRPPSLPLEQDPRAQSNPNLAEAAVTINRHLTPNNFVRRSSLPRPNSSYSIYSDFGPRGRSPAYGGAHNRAPSSHSNSRKSPETRPSSFAELLNVPYPQPAPAPITFDNSQLRSAVGNNASLLSAQKTLEMYRQNVKKTNDLSIQYSFAVFLIATAQEQGLDLQEVVRTKSPKLGRDTPSTEGSQSSPNDLVREARAILQKLSNNGYPFAQYYLADGYASGLFSKGKEDYNSAFPLFVLAAKHGHAESAYRTALCYEFAWGCRKDPTKAVQFLRTAASRRHPGAMTRLGKACLSGDLGEKRYREGIKWLKLATESADAIYNAAPYHLGCLYETGYGDDIFLDENYAAELFTQAADLGHPEANFRMGDAYEHGKLNCPRDPALSVHFYTGAAERGHAGAMMGLCAWYMVGAEPILEKDEEEAYEWARRAAELGMLF